MRDGVCTVWLRRRFLARFNGDRGGLCFMARFNLPDEKRRKSYILMRAERSHYKKKKKKKRLAQFAYFI